MKKYAVHYFTTSPTGNTIRSNQVALVRAFTNTPFAGYLQRYIDRKLPNEECLITSVIDISSDNIYERRVRELLPRMAIKQDITITHKDASGPILINFEEVTE